MATQNVVNNEPNSFFDIPDLPFELQRRPIQVLKSTTDSVLTNSTVETTLFEGTVLPDWFSDSAIIELYALLSVTNSANAKTIKISLGGVLVASISPVTSRSSLVIGRTIFNRGRKNQISVGQFESFQVGSSNAAVQAFTIDTTIEMIFRITGQLAVATESIILRGSYVRVTHT